MEECMGNLREDIQQWIFDYAQSAGAETLVVGVSGGIDSAVVSTLCASTGLPTIVLSMPIRQDKEQHDLSVDHCLSLLNTFTNVQWETIDLTDVFTKFEDLFNLHNTTLAMANSRSRLRMMTLYATAQNHNGIVVGTGNKVEDFGVGFFTKYGDGGVDILPIADLTKTEVWDLGKQLGVNQAIIDAQPTDGLWDDGRVDEDQLNGLTYVELERCMDLEERGISIDEVDNLTAAKLRIYREIRERNLHKMQPIPVFKR